MYAAFRQYLRDFLSYANDQILRAVGYSFAGALTEGFGLLLLLPILQLVAGESDAPLALWLGETMRAIGLHSIKAQVIALIAGFMGLIVLRSFITWKRTTLLARISQGFIDQWRSRIFQALANAKWQTLLNVQMHEGQHAILQDVNRMAGGTHHILQGSVTAIMVLVQLGVSFLISPDLTALVLVLILVSALILPRLMRRARRLGARQTQAGKQLQQTLVQFMAGLKLVKVYRTEAAHVAHFDNNVGEIRHEILRFGVEQATAQAIFQISSALMLSITVMLGLFVLNTSPLTLITVVIIMARISGPAFGLFKGAQLFANMLPAHSALYALLARLENDEVPVDTMLPKPEGALGVKFQEVSFRYENGADTQIDGLNMKVDAGQMIALIGPSGAGKSTVLDLMNGLLTPSSGQVQVGDLSTSDPQALGAIARALAYVPQDSFLIDRTLREALLMDTKNASDSEIENALRLTGADKIVAGLPEGLDYMVGDRGQRFSGGERQRFCLSRALLRQPGLLILDEATSALDRASEELILAGLRKDYGHMTIVVVTHRAVDPKIFDQIISLEAQKDAGRGA
ncbi:ABC transporter ATP-binding protein [Planktotalea sp.]|uniref:ABC transporter ATP-binding protein n=1 Tax=Planktotalea sp. TaxID=2029877 RepID=UPI003D6A5D4B